MYKPLIRYGGIHIFYFAFIIGLVAIGTKSSSIISEIEAEYFKHTILFSASSSDTTSIQNIQRMMGQFDRLYLVAYMPTMAGLIFLIFLIVWFRFNETTLPQSERRPNETSSGEQPNEEHSTIDGCPAGGGVQQQ